MPLELTATARALSSQDIIEQQIILEIEGLPVIFSAIQNTKFLKYGDANTLYGDAGLVYGALIEDPNSRPYISLDGTSYNIRQQIKPDRGSTGSIQKININLIDRGQEVTRLLQPQNVISDPLSSRANVYLNFKGGSHPEDSVLILSGIIDNIEFGAGNCLIQVSHPDDLRRAEIFNPYESTLSSAIDDTTTTIPVVTTEDLFVDQDALQSYIQINDEIIKVGNINANNIENCVRGQFGTIADSHDLDDDVTSIYKLTGNPIDLALKIMLSGSEEFYIQDLAVTSFENISGAFTIDNAVFFAGVNLAREQGVSRGDLITITGASNPTNNIVDAEIGSIINNEFGTALILADQNIIQEDTTAALCSFKTPFNTLPDGCRLKPREVDVEQHLLIQDQFNSSFFQYDIDLKEEITARDFIDQQIYFPQGLFLTPRKGKISCAITVPPLAERESRILTSDTVKKPDSLKISRSTNVNFYNAITYKFEKDIVTDDFTRGVITSSASSINRIDTRNKPLVIESDGLRDNPDTREKITRQTRRFLDRYQFAAERIRVEVPYKVGFAIEIADTVIFGEEDLQVTDNTSGSREFQPRTMEVTNKSLNIRSGSVVLELLDTAFGVDGRFASISPSSLVNSGATVSTIPLKKSFSTEPSELEQDKWQDYINETVFFRSPDFTFAEETRLLGFDPANPDVMLVDPLSSAPPEDFIIEPPDYSGTNQQNRIWKSLHCSFDPQVTVVNGIDEFNFEVSASDALLFQENKPVRVHTEDYSIDSTGNLDDGDAQVTEINGQIITVNRSLGFIPANGQLVDLIGFQDGGQPYRLV